MLRRKENLICVRIFHFGSGRKTADIDITAVGREWTDNQALFAGNRGSVKQTALSFFRGRGCLRCAYVVSIWGRSDCAARSLAIRSIARRSLIILLTTAPVRPRFRLRMRDGAT